MPLEDNGGPTDLVEVGWHLHPDWQGGGFATEATRAVLERAKTAGIVEVLAVVDLDNEPSHRVALRLGMTDEGLTDRWYGQTLRAYRKVLGAAGP
jgi:RimJ/RimL family protein N-acetyltransferase